MSASNSLREPVYAVAGAPTSMHDLLRHFTSEGSKHRGITRLSDLHMKVGHPVRYRFDADLVALPYADALTDEVLRKLLFPLLAKEHVARLMGRPPQDVDVSFDAEDLDMSFRINAFHDRDGLAATIRALPRFVPGIDELGLPDPKLAERLSRQSQGLVLVTGVTGSGKSTTIASLIQEINRTRQVRVITLEDPVEYVLESRESLISQREIGRHTPTFHDGLRSALREDPDIIFVGEMRDPETTQLALTAAETGHLVLSTLHTKDARGALSRIVDMYPPERTKEIATQLSFSLSTVIAQKLVPRASGQGRLAAYEVLHNIAPVGHAIRTSTWHQLYSVMQTQTQHGLSTIERQLNALVADGTISRDDALRAANVPDAIG